MIKLVKKTEDKILYWEVWEDNRTLIIHFGTVGDEGETEEKKLSIGQRANKAMQTLAENKIKEGYQYLNEDELIQFVIKYLYDEENTDLEQIIEARHAVEELMNENLGWTGNGHCDGGDIGSGSANIFCYVVDIQIASNTIKEALKNKHILEGAILAYLDQNEDYVVVYPKEAEFSIL